MEQQIKNILKQLRLNESMISTLLGVGVVIVVGALLYNYFSAKPTGQPSDLDLTGMEESVEIGQAPKGLPVTHKVQKGEDLWAIAEKYYGSGYNWTDIAAENNLGNADALVEGMELTIPSVPAKVQVSTPAPAAGTGKYTTQAGESLWDIAVKVYADGYRWPKIWEANKDKIGKNPDRLETGIELTIP
jgi:nucleoid-associated protein YgaU